MKIQDIVRSLFGNSRTYASLSKEKKEALKKVPMLEEFLSGDVEPKNNPYKRVKGTRYIENQED